MKIQKLASSGAPQQTIIGDYQISNFIFFAELTNGPMVNVTARFITMGLCLSKSV